MSAFVVATVRVTDPERYAAYGRAVAGLAERFGAVPLMRGAVSAILEGEGTPGERVVVLRFETAEAARGYIGSPDYQGAAALREGAATVTMRLIEG